MKLKKLTLGLQEHALLNTGLEGAVEEGVEHGVGSVDVVVGLDILLQALATMDMSCQQWCSVLMWFVSPQVRVTMASCIWCGGMKHVVRAGRKEAAYLEPLRSLSWRGE